MGHTKFSLDWCFGLFKQAYRRTKIGCLDDIAKVVESSAVVNHTQLVDGQVIVPTYDWAEHFNAPFFQSALKGINAPPHLSPEARHCGRQRFSHQPRKIDLLQDKSWKPTRTDLPPVIPPPGLIRTAAVPL